jgi:chitinase
MIWASDLDDTKFTALSGLIGQEVRGNVKDPNDGKSVSQDWSSKNGQKCYLTSDCLAVHVPTTIKCRKGEQMIGWDKDDCKDTDDLVKGKPIYCPIDAYPTKCTWRGSTPACNGQCHEGILVYESALSATLTKNRRDNLVRLLVGRRSQ